MSLGGFGFARWRGRGAMDGFANALVRAAAADVAAHEVIDIGIGGIGLFIEERDCGHDLSGLAITALGNVFCNPSLLDGMKAVRRQALDGGDFLSGHAGNRRDTGTCHFAVDVHGASAAKRHTAPEFGPGHVQRVSQDPEQRHIRADVHSLELSVKDKRNGHGNPPGGKG